jgi:hypothetical protein
MIAAYQHPEGASINLDCTTLTVTAENGQAASIQIGPDGLRDLAKKIKAHATDFENAMYLEGLSNNGVFHATGQHPAKVSASINLQRPTIGTLGDVLKQTVDHAPDGFTRITGSTASRWYELQEEHDTLYLEVDAVTACLEIQDDVTVFIRQGVTIAQARALLKAIAKEIKDYGSFENFTPLVPVSDDSVPF